jgi:lysophospholipase L1-like esterase
MKKILCYGDSNTYGFVPETCGRYEKTERWTGIISNELAPEYEVLEQGLNNRMGFFKSPESLKHCGGEYLSIYLQNHKDIDICILALGTNDAQFFYNLNEEITHKGLLHLINSVREANKNTKIILIPPVTIKENILNGIFSMQFDENSIETIKKIFPIYEKTAKENACYYLDFNEFVAPSEKDGLHYSKDSHKIIAQHIIEFIKSIN